MKQLFIISALIYLLTLTSMAVWLIINGISHLAELFKDIKGDEDDETQQN